jgi:hypothetical protein
MKFKMHPHLRAFICVHVLENSKPVLLVSRADGGEWCFLCGDTNHNDVSSIRAVGIVHVFERDPTLLELQDLDVDWDAEREGVGKPWLKTRSLSN